MKNIHEDVGVVTPHIKRKYLVILSLIVILIIMSPSYFTGIALWSVCICLSGLALCVWWLYVNFRFQRIYRKLRPFVMTRVLQILSILGFFALCLIWAPQMMMTWAFIPYAIYWIIYVCMVWQFFAIFTLAKEAKKKYPDRCEFC